MAKKVLEGLNQCCGPRSYAIVCTDIQNKMIIFCFAGMIKKENESAFNYNLTAGNFSKYNTHHTKPRFLEDLVGNLTALFSNSSKQQISQYNKTCEENKECLLAIARSGDIHLGEAIMDKVHQDQLRKEIAGLCIFARKDSVG